MNTQFFNLVNHTLNSQKIVTDEIDNEIAEYCKLSIREGNILNIVMINTYGKLMIKNIIKTLRILTQYKFSPFIVYDNDKRKVINHSQINFDYRLEYQLKLLGDMFNVSLYVYPIINGEIYQNKHLEIRLIFGRNIKFNGQFNSELNINYVYNELYKNNLLRKIKNVYKDTNENYMLLQFNICTNVYLKTLLWENIPNELSKKLKFTKNCIKESEFSDKSLFRHIQIFDKTNVNWSMIQHPCHRNNLMYYDTNFIQSIKKSMSSNNDADRRFVKLLIHLLTDMLDEMNTASMVDLEDKKYLFNKMNFNDYRVKRLINNIEKFKIKAKKENKKYEKIS